MCPKSIQIISNIKKCEGLKKLHCDILMDAWEEDGFLFLQRGFLNWDTMTVNRETITKISL
jgi:hypothetical protein